MNSAIKAISVFLPPDVLSNDELSRRFPEWSVAKIAAKTGIVERHIARPEVTASDLGVEAARALFSEHRVNPADIDYLLFCTQSPDYFLPTTACVMQERLGLPRHIGALDFNLGCSGFVYGLSLARGLIATGDARQVLLITAETYSKFIHPGDKSVRTLFGDGAAATLVSAVEGEGLSAFVFGTDGRGANELIVPTGGMRARATGQSKEVTDEGGSTRDGDSLFMNGPDIFNFTLREVPPLVEAVLAGAKLKADEVDLFVFHQANAWMLEALRKKLKLPEEKFFVSLAHCGNTVSATIPIALAEAQATGRVRPGARVMLVGFGVGYSWAGCIARF